MNDVCIECTKDTDRHHKGDRFVLEGCVYIKITRIDIEIKYVGRKIVFDREYYKLVEVF